MSAAPKRISCAGVEVPARWSSTILLTATAFLGAGALAFATWRLTGDQAWIEQYFRVPGALLLVVLAAAQVALSLRVRRQFAPGEPMRLAWTLIAFSAFANMSGIAFSQLPGVTSFVRQTGQALGATLRFALLIPGLFQALRVYRRSGFLGKLSRFDGIVLSLIGIYIVLETRGLASALRAGWRPRGAEVLEWPVDPLLWVLLAEAMLLSRSVALTGLGRIGQCWRAFSLGVLLMALGDIGLWAASCGYISWPWTALTWYIRVPAEACFAAAAAYKLEAIQSASAGA